MARRPRCGAWQACDRSGRVGTHPITPDNEHRRLARKLSSAGIQERLLEMTAAATLLPRDGDEIGLLNSGSLGRHRRQRYLHRGKARFASGSSGTAPAVES